MAQTLAKYCQNILFLRILSLTLKISFAKIRRVLLRCYKTDINLSFAEHDIRLCKRFLFRKKLLLTSSLERAIKKGKMKKIICYIRLYCSNCFVWFLNEEVFSKP